MFTDDNWGSTSKEKDYAKADGNGSGKKDRKESGNSKNGNTKQSRYGNKYDTRYPEGEKQHNKFHGHRCHQYSMSGANGGAGDEHRFVSGEDPGNYRNGRRREQNGGGGNDNNGYSNGGNGDRGNPGGRGNSGGQGNDCNYNSGRGNESDCCSCCGENNQDEGDMGGANNGGPVGGGGHSDKWYRTANLPELKPNKFWTEQDVDILMFLEARHTDEKWLQIQAGFYNWTGRMVDSDIIKAKFIEDGRY